MTFLAIFGFLNLSFIDIIDILLVAIIIYLVFRWIRGSSAMGVFTAILLLLLVRVIAGALNMKLMTAVMSTVLDVGVLALIIIFQPEIRRLLMGIGNKYRRTPRLAQLLDKLLGVKEDSLDTGVVNEIAEACRQMSEDKTGALMVIPQKDKLEYIKETGDKVDAMVSRRLIMNIFFKNSPLHDGAMVIEGGRIAAARCTLPITERQDIPAHYGMRHKAAIGMSETCDAIILVVSEETGHISYVRNGKIQTVSNISELKLLLSPSSAERQNDRENDAPTE
jgi:diadenylate cyclase